MFAKTTVQSLMGVLILLATSLQGQDFNFKLQSKLNFPGQTLANVFGYTQDGREYALVGGSKGLIIVDVTTPATPVVITQIPGPDNLWKEIKTYKSFCYVTTEGGGGLQVIDLSALPSDNLTYFNYTGDGAIFNALNTIHALHVDTTLGFLYAYGSNLFNGGAVVLDIHTDPYNPVYVGKFDQLGYIHDGYADNDTLYGSHIYTGLLSITDMRDKQNPVLLGTIQTPGKFTHNSWLLIDHKTILTTDETTPSFVTAYNIEDPSDIQETDRFSTNDGFGSIGHNTHILNDWAITSWYTDGLTIADAHKPDNLVITGWYDTWNGTGANFDGCWGTYPFFPSGTVLATNINPADLFILSPTYVRACYLEGSVLDGCSGLPLNDVSIDVNSNDRWIDTRTNNNGVFETGQTQTGNFSVTLSKPGYVDTVIAVALQTAQTVNLNISLKPISAYTLNVQVTDAITSAPIPNTPLIIGNSTVGFSGQTDANGQFSLNCVLGGVYSALASAWGYLPNTIDVNSNNLTNIALESGYYDDFGVDLGWTTAASASAGFWTRAKPNGTTFQNESANPGVDIDSDSNDKCYVTGNAGGAAGADDVDNGTVTLTTPPMQLALYEDAVLRFDYWFFNAGGGGTPDDSLEVLVTNGLDTVSVFTEKTSASAWRTVGDIHLNDFIALTDNVRVHFITGDNQQTGHIVEAGIDGFVVVPEGLMVDASEPGTPSSMQVWPNPSNGAFQLRVPIDQPNAHFRVHNALGQSVWAHTGAVTVQDKLTLGQQWPAGVYWLTLENEGQVLETVKLVKR